MGGGDSGDDFHPDWLRIILGLACCCFHQGKIACSHAFCVEAVADFDANSVVLHPIASGAADRAHVQALIDEDDDVVFPFVLFQADGG